MTEAVFILTIIYVAYVVYRVADNQKDEMQANKQKSAVKTVLTPSGSVPTTESTEPAVAAVKNPEPVVAEKTAVKAETKTTKLASNELRHPETGEIAKISTNYRGLKRWLKEALVTEGLLEKVYPANEVNDEINAKIKQALEKIKAMPKYNG